MGFRRRSTPFPGQFRSSLQSSVCLCGRRAVFLIVELVFVVQETQMRTHFMGKQGRASLCLSLWVERSLRPGIRLVQ